MPVVEGSVDIDGEGFVDEGFDEESGSEEGENQDIDNSSTSEEGEEKNSEGENQDENQSDENADNTANKTDKGTKLAQDPLQQANQLRANAERELKEYQEFLQNPEQLEAYLNDLRKSKGISAPKSPAQTEADKKTQEVLSVDPDKIETVDDLRNYAKALRQTVTDQVEAIKQELGGMKEGQARHEFARKFDATISDVRNKYPMLKPTNPDGTPNPNFNAEFDEKLGKLYESLDFDTATKQFRGKVDFMMLADTLAGMMDIGKKNGSTQAQTIIKDKTRGKIAGSPADTSSNVDESKMSASQLIASRIKRARSSTRSRR